MTEIGYIEVPGWANTLKSTRGQQNSSSDKKVDAQNANCISKMETFWKSTISFPAHKAVRIGMITSNSFTDIAMTLKPQEITSQRPCKVCMIDTRALRSRMNRKAHVRF
jgi:hypothetical protein